MTTCPFCLAMASRSKAALDNRIANIKAYPEVRIAECPQCGGTEWATTDATIHVAPLILPMTSFKLGFHQATGRRMVEVYDDTGEFCGAIYPTHDGSNAIHMPP